MKKKSRKGAKYMGYEASDSSGKLWVLGIREMASKSAVDTLSVFKEILSDIDCTCQQAENEPSKVILQHIVATISDRATTKVKFNTLLKDYRDERSNNADCHRKLCLRMKGKPSATSQTCSVVYMLSSRLPKLQKDQFRRPRK